MKKAVETIVKSFKTQLQENNQKIAELEKDLIQRKEFSIKLIGALEGFALLDEESKKPENQPEVQLDDEDEEDEE
mgnify:FL=1